MKTPFPTIGAGLVLVAAIFATPVSAAGVQDDCRLTPPPDTTPDSTMSDNVPDSTITTDTLTDRLATCGSVLDPPALGDSDIVEPTPPVGDDINIHPDAPATRP